jgi:type II secretory pathway component PulK
MKIPVQPGTRGIALVIVMIAIFILSVMAAVLATSMKVETKLAQNADHDQELLWLGRSGVELARWVLSEQMTIPNEPYDSLNQVWAGGPGGIAESNSPLAGLSLDNYQVGDGTVSVKIIDLERKVNINTVIANPGELQQALTLMGVGADGISVISDSILDWIGPTASPRPGGAESDYYQTLDPPYYAKNAPMDDLSELLLIRGIREHPEIYWGGSPTNQAPDRFRQKLGFVNSPFQVPDYPFGLTNIFTAISIGRINVNTADANVLQMLPGVDETTAQNIIKQRAGPDGEDGTSDDTPFTNPGGITAAGAPAAAANLCVVRSSTFEVHVTARLGDYHRDYVAILYRNSPTDIQILSFYWE